MSVVLRRLFVTNPILEEATRAWRKFFRIAGGPGKGLSYLAVGIIALIYVWILAEVMLSHDDSSAGILFFQLTVVTLAMPISVYGAISGERERTTWEALILTRLTPGQIVWGKILWRLAGLLILMALFGVPLMIGAGTAHGLGRATMNVGSLIDAEILTFAWGFVLCAYGLWVSANTRHSVTSAALIFISLLIILALLPALLSMVGGAGMTSEDFAGNYPAWALMHVNAFYAMGQIVSQYDRVAYNQDQDGGDPLHGTEWSLLPIAIYLIGAGVFLYVAYRSLKIWEEPKHRIG
jgi:ABC-type transport system involved in multi-copper enzyme maturation permease subunit